MSASFERCRWESLPVILGFSSRWGSLHVYNPKLARAPKGIAGDTDWMLAEMHCAWPGETAGQKGMDSRRVRLAGHWGDLSVSRRKGHAAIAG